MANIKNNPSVAFGDILAMRVDLYLRQSYSILILKTEHQFNTSVWGSSYILHVGNNKNHFVMTIVMWIRVHPYKATHYENRKNILHFIAFMVLHVTSAVSEILGCPKIWKVGPMT